MRIRVYYEDTDCGNVVYYANYLRYMERSRTEFLRERGIDLAGYHAKGLLFAVAEAHIRYKAPARYDDLLDVESCIVDVTPATILMRTVIKRESDGTLLVDGETRLACIVATSGKPSRIPREIRETLSRQSPVSSQQSGTAG
jgi:acyl-CoA thioester hydrolase